MKRDKIKLKEQENKKDNKCKNIRSKTGITMLVLVITIILILILASAIIVTLSKTDPIDEANEVVLKNDIQAMKDEYELKRKNILFENFGDKTKIKDSDFKDIIPDKYKKDFTAGKDGIAYIGADEKIKDIAEEMGIGKEKGNNLENVVTVAEIDNIQIEAVVKKHELVKEYYFYIREKGTDEWKGNISDQNNIVVNNLKEQTTYEVKVKVVGKDEKEEESKIKEVTTKGIKIGNLIIRENDKSGKEYIEGTWSKENIYVEVSGENTTYTCTGANEVRKTDKANVLTNEGITKVTLETKIGSNVARKEYEIKIDKTAPEGSIVEKVQIPNGKNDTDMIVKVEGNDNLSGVKEYEYYVDNKLLTITKLKEYKYEKLTDGKHEIKVVIVDEAGNKKQIAEEEIFGVLDVNHIQVEKTPQGWTNEDVTLRITYEESEIYTPQYKEENGTWNDVTREHEVKISENKRVYVRYIYRNGNEEKATDEREIVIDNIDKEIPEIMSLTSSNNNTTNQNVTLTAKAIDHLSGIIAYLFSTDGSLTANSAGWKNITNTKVEMTQTHEASENGTYYFYVKDEAGNVTKKEIKIANIDKTAPTLSSIAVTSPATGTYKAGQVVTMVATYSENIKGTAPVLKVKFDTGTERTAKAGAITNNTITYTYNITSGDNGGLVSTSYTGSITDMVGNSLAVGNKALTGNNIIADTTPPPTRIPTLTSNTNSITAVIRQIDGDVDYATRAYAIKKTSESTWGEWITSNSASYTFANLEMNTSYQVKTKISDTVGNTSESEIATISTVNITKPTIVAPTEWTNQDVIVTITYPDIVGTTGQYSTNGTEWINANVTTTTKNVTVTTNNTTIYARVIDSTNQTGATATYKVTNIDKVPPAEFTLTSSGATINSFVITGATTDNESGIKEYDYYYKKSNETTYQKVTTTNSRYTFTSLPVFTTYNIYVVAKDKVGNVRQSNTLTTRTLYELKFDRNVLNGGTLSGNTTVATWGSESSIGLVIRGLGTATAKPGEHNPSLSTIPNKWTRAFDFTYCNYLEFYFQKYAGNGSVGIYIDNDYVFDIWNPNVASGTWTKYTVDLRKYTGRHALTIVGGYYYDKEGDPNSTTYYRNIRLYE